MARKQRITITLEDRERLEDLFASSIAEALVDKPYLRDLRGELDSAQVVSQDQIPDDVITMNSTVRLKDMKSREIESFKLVYPDEANIADGRLSILAPLGTAILGCRVGDTVRWKIPDGVGRWRVEEVVFQPEREGVAA